MDRTLIDGGGKIPWQVNLAYLLLALEQAEGNATAVALMEIMGKVLECPMKHSVPHAKQADVVFRSVQPNLASGEYA